MAREPTMKHLYSAQPQMSDASWPSLTVLSDQRLLSSLGGNLRSVYETMTNSAQPSDLLRLAAQIDERRGFSEG